MEARQDAYLEGSELYFIVGYQTLLDPIVTTKTMVNRDPTATFDLADPRDVRIHTIKGDVVSMVYYLPIRFTTPGGKIKPGWVQRFSLLDLAKAPDITLESNEGLP